MKVGTGPLGAEAIAGRKNARTDAALAMVVILVTRLSSTATYLARKKSLHVHNRSIHAIFREQSFTHVRSHEYVNRALLPDSFLLRPVDPNIVFLTWN